MGRDRDGAEIGRRNAGVAERAERERRCQNENRKDETFKRQET